VRSAIVKEQAAQRAEELAKSAEDVSKADRPPPPMPGRRP
jgi:hypothetical protein